MIELNTQDLNDKLDLLSLKAFDHGYGCALTAMALMMDSLRDKTTDERRNIILEQMEKDREQFLADLKATRQ